MLSFFLHFAVCLCLLFAIRVPARNIGLVDVPGERKLHKSRVPLVGGLGLAVTILAFHFFGFYAVTAPVHYILFFGYLILVIGVVDDRQPLGSLTRLVLQTVVVLLTIYFSGLYVDRLDTILAPSAPLTLGFFGVVFTVFCITGVINASNMIDGVDGLLGCIFSVSLLALGTLAFVAGVDDVASVSFGLVGAMCAFLMFNLGVFGAGRAVFLGDAGSTYTGFIAGFLLIALSEPIPAVISTASAGWLFGFPLMDSVSVIVRRLTQGKSALQADNDHFHHRLLQAGFSSRQVLLIVVAIHIGFVVVGVVANLILIPGYLLFYGFVLLTVLFHVKNDTLIDWLRSVGLAQIDSPRRSIESDK